MKGKLINKYGTISEKTGKPVRVYVYKVHSYTADELADYQLVLGKSYRNEEGTGEPLFYTPVFEGNNIEIVKSKGYDETGKLVDAYKPLGSEDFELKRSMIDSERRAAESQPIAQPSRRVMVSNKEAKL